MIFLRNKKQATKNRQQVDSQAGVTLLLAILVLSSVMAISFSLAAILFTETRSSADLIRTEPAYYGANGVAEDALFKVKRKTCLPGACTYTTNFSNNVVQPTVPVQTSTTTPIYQVKVPANSIFSSASRYSMYDASSGSLTAGSNYTKITLTYLDTGTADTLNIWLCEFDPTFGVDPNGDSNNTYNTPPCSDPRTGTVGASSGYWLHPNITITRGQTITWTDLHPSMQQELLLFNPSTTDDIVVNIETFTGLSPNYVPTGLPYAGQTAVEINTANTTVGRKIRVIIPNVTASTVAPSDTVWVEDSLPAGAAPNGDSEGWNWLGASPTPFSGTVASQSNLVSGEHQHYFSGASPTFTVNPGDNLVAYVYLDPTNPPTEVMLQWNDGVGGWSHRAYWGNNSCNSGWGTNGSPDMYQMSASVPVTGQWVRLSVPASLVGLATSGSSNLNGMAFTLCDGQATWDHAGKSP